MNNIRVFQIYYDQQTRQSLDSGFIPLDNADSLRPDWYEFWVIRKYLLENKLAEGHWYGFLSPRFFEKTGLDAQQLTGFLNHFDAVADVAIVSFPWDQIAYFLNPFEQGEFWIPGLTDVSQRLFDKAGIGLDCRNYVAHSQNWITSNFVIAKPAFWKRWLPLANSLFDAAEYAKSGLSEALSGSTAYRSHPNLAHQPAMKVFVQERIAPVVLATGSFRVVAADLSASAPVFDRLFTESPRTRRLLQICDAMKQEYCSSKDGDYLEMYRKVRASIPIGPRIPQA